MPKRSISESARCEGYPALDDDGRWTFDGTCKNVAKHNVNGHHICGVHLRSMHSQLRWRRVLGNVLDIDSWEHTNA